MGIDVKTTAALEDELFTTLLKCFHYQEVVMNSQDVEEIARAAKLAQSTNDRRNQLKIAIDERLGNGATAELIKTYTHEEIGRRFSMVERIDQLEAALIELYDASIQCEQRIGVAKEHWHHVLFAATGNAFRVIHAKDAL